MPSDPKVVTAMIKATLRTSDVAACLADGAYGLVLEDTPEDGAVWAVERLRALARHKPGQPGAVGRCGLLPGQALTPPTSSSPRQAAFATAREWSQDRIEVAPPTPSRARRAPAAGRCPTSPWEP